MENDVTKELIYFISFDIDTKLLKEIHGESKYRLFYKEIEKFLSLDFIRIQGSVYKSKKKISRDLVTTYVTSLGYEYYKESSCFKNIIIAVAPEVYDVTAKLHNAGKEKEEILSDKKVNKSNNKKPKKKVNLLDRDFDL